jgi:hypothetical protein
MPDAVARKSSPSGTSIVTVSTSRGSASITGCQESPDWLKP